MAAKPMPRAGRPARTAGTAQPPRTPGATEGQGKMRERGGAEEPYNPLGRVNGPPGELGKVPDADTGKRSPGP
jgi:hypothetical protein